MTLSFCALCSYFCWHPEGSMFLHWQEILKSCFLFSEFSFITGWFHFTHQSHGRHNSSELYRFVTVWCSYRPGSRPDTLFFSYCFSYCFVCLRVEQNWSSKVIQKLAIFSTKLFPILLKYLFTICHIICNEMYRISTGKKLFLFILSSLHPSFNQEAFNQLCSNYKPNLTDH